MSNCVNCAAAVPPGQTLYWRPTCWHPMCGTCAGKWSTRTFCSAPVCGCFDGPPYELWPAGAAFPPRVLAELTGPDPDFRCRVRKTLPVYRAAEAQFGRIVNALQGFLQSDNQAVCQAAQTLLRKLDTMGFCAAVAGRVYQDLLALAPPWSEADEKHAVDAGWDVSVARDLQNAEEVPELTEEELLRSAASLEEQDSDDQEDEAVPAVSRRAPDDLDEDIEVELA